MFALKTATPTPGHPSWHVRCCSAAIARRLCELPATYIILRIRGGGKAGRGRGIKARRCDLSYRPLGDQFAKPEGLSDFEEPQYHTS